MPGDGTGPFLWLSKEAPPHGYRALPESGMCVSAFLFVERDGKVLLGKYAPHPEWERLAGLDPERQEVHGRGWTIPASQVKFGETPIAAARRIARDLLRLPGAVEVTAARIGSDHYVPRRFPELGMHYDLWLLFGARLAPGAEVVRPPWYRELAWLDPGALPPDAFARGHEDVLAQWLKTDERQL